MAISVRTTVAGGDSTGTGDRTVTITPAVNDLFIVWCNVSVNANTAPTCSDDNGGTYSLITTAQYNLNFSANTLSCFVRNQLLANTTSTTITVATGSNTSGTVIVYALSGAGPYMFGLAAIRQSKIEPNELPGGGNNPAIAFTLSCLTGNMTLGAVANLSNPAALTEPSGWVEDQDTGQSTPAEGLETVSRASGFTGTDIVWGSESPTNFSAIIIELDSPRANYLDPLMFGGAL